jgi:hypothetical protein
MRERADAHANDECKMANDEWVSLPQIWAELGIPADYAARRGLPPQPEAKVTERRTYPRLSASFPWLSSVKESVFVSIRVHSRFKCMDPANLPVKNRATLASGHFKVLRLVVAPLLPGRF